jgi:hypothetical protein
MKLEIGQYIAVTYRDGIEGYNRYCKILKFLDYGGEFHHMECMLPDGDR